MFVEGCFAQGVLVGYKLNNPTTVRVAPLLNITEQEMDASLRVMADVIAVSQSDRAH